MNNKQKKQIEKRILNSLVFHHNKLSLSDLNGLISKFSLSDLNGLISDLEDIVISTKKLRFTSKTNPIPKNFDKWIGEVVSEYNQLGKTIKVTKRDKEIYYDAYLAGYFDAYEDLTGYHYEMQGNFSIG